MPSGAGYVDFDVTGLVNGEVLGDRTATIGITTDSNNWTSFNTKEAAAGVRPQLVVTSALPPPPPQVTDGFRRRHRVDRRLPQLARDQRHRRVRLRLPRRPGRAEHDLAWSNLNQVSLRFSEAVTVASGDLVVNGVNVATYGVANLRLRPRDVHRHVDADRTIPNDKLTLNLDERRRGPTYASTLRVLPGDIDRNNAVNIFDFNVLRPNLNVTGAGVLGGDINGDNVVNIFDFNDFKTYLGKTTPA